jgi:hypothetical protein
MHPTGFLIDRSVLDTGHVFFPRTLSVNVLSGTQAFPLLEKDPGSGNRLLIFTGTVAAELRGSDDKDARHGVLRIRLHHPLEKSVTFIGSATVAALAAFHTDDDKVLFGVNSAETTLGPNPDNAPLFDGPPADDLYVTLDLSIQSEDAHLDRICYQANVLVRDDTPDLKSILVRRDSSAAFAESALISPGSSWQYQVTFTGPVLKPTALVIVASSDSSHIPMSTLPGLTASTFVEVQQHDSSVVAGAAPVHGSGLLDSPLSTITASFTRADGSVAQKKATIQVAALS